MAKRGLIILVVVWGVLLMAPMFRAQTARMRVPLSESTASWPYPPLFNAAELARLTRAHPESATLALAQIEMLPEKYDDAYGLKFDALVARYPDDLSVRRAKLIKSTSGGLVRRVYQPLSPQPARSSREIERFKSEWQTPVQRAILVEQAREGTEQAPDDGLFPWVAAMALWNRDDEPSLRALQRASKCRDFGSGLFPETRALIAWREKQEPLQWDEKLATLSTQTLSHLAQMRNLQEEITWSGIARYRRGDKAGAYRRWKIVLEASAAFRRSQTSGSDAFLIGLLVAEGMQKSVWNVVARELQAPTPFSQAQSSNLSRLADFKALARRDGRADLADLAARENASLPSEKINPGRTMFPFENALGLHQTSTRLSLQLPWIARRVFVLSLIGALALLICVVWRRAEVGIGRVSPAQIAFFGALWSGILTLVAFHRTDPSLQIFYGQVGSENQASLVPLLQEIFQDGPLFWIAVFVTLASAIALCYWQRVRDDRRIERQVLANHKRAKLPFPLWPTLTAFTGLLFLFSALALVVSSSPDERHLLLSTYGLLAVTALGLTIFQHMRRPESRLTRTCLGGGSAVFMLVAFGLANGFGLNDNVSILWYVVVLTLGALAILVYLGATATTWRPMFARALTTALQTLGGVAVICSVALLLASLAALPVRARQNRIVDDYVAQGEIDWMKNQPSIVNARARGGK